MKNQENTPEAIKSMVREKYANIAKGDKAVIQASCCGATESSKEVYNIMSEEYEMNGYKEEADLGLGCGLPTQFAMITEGNTVVDLGSGAGNDCFVARHEAGAAGKVIGIDFTPEMIELARKNAVISNYNNVEFRQGDIEEMPVLESSVDVVVSNCVLNLLPKKDRIFSEISRVLRPGGHFSISDIVLKGALPEELTDAAEMYAGCVSGAIQKEAYLELIEKAGFENIKIQKEKSIIIPDDILQNYLDDKGLEDFKSGSTGIFSITVFGVKRGDQQDDLKVFAQGEVCTPGGGCC
ncbi:MAG: arsenite methyltransferase [Saprospiraceae bacterium]|jgi:arsenite methyltransferase